MTREKLLPEDFTDYELGYCLGKTDILIDQLGRAARDLQSLADQSQRQYVSPSRVGYLTDMGRSRKGCKISARLRGRVEDYIFSLEHPDFKQEVLSIPLIQDWDVIPAGKFSRIKTNFQLLSQAGEAMTTREEIKTLRRHIIFYFQQKETMEKERAIEEKMDNLTEKFLARVEKNEGQGHGRS